jgi:hypothetical protein
MREAVELRRALAQRGLTVASWVPDASTGRSADLSVRPARLLEDDRLTWHAVGPAEPWSEPVAFLDGIQHLETVAYAGATPLFIAEIAAAVRERHERRLVTALVERRVLALGRPSALAAAAAALGELHPVELPDDADSHPLIDRRAAAEAVDRARGDLEVAVGSRWRATGTAWLVLDGSLAESPAWAEDPRMVGVMKSHATLPFSGPDLERYLRLPPGQRSSLFAPASRRLAPVRSWGLRLWPWEGKDLFHGLVRVEVAPANGTPARADELSRWLLAERAPVSTPDPRWDRLLYGVHGVGEYLRAGKA